MSNFVNYVSNHQLGTHFYTRYFAVNNYEFMANVWVSFLLKHKIYKPNKTCNLLNISHEYLHFRSISKFKLMKVMFALPESPSALVDRHAVDQIWSNNLQEVKIGNFE